MKEKRMIGGYEILSAVSFGAEEVILAEKRDSPLEERFLCGYLETNDIFQSCTRAMVGADYVELAELFGQRVVEEAQQFKEKQNLLDAPITVITEADCIPDDYRNDINGKIIAVDVKCLKPEFQRADKQLYLVTGGFGASANSRGSAVFCKNIYSGKSTRFERMDVIGEIKPEKLPDWAKEKLGRRLEQHRQEQER